MGCACRSPNSRGARKWLRARKQAMRRFLKRAAVRTNRRTSMATELAYGRMLDLTIRDVSVVIPAKHFDISKAFYMALGWRLIEIDPTLAALELANRRLYLQNFYIRRWAENTVLTIAVEDAYAWHE